MTHSTFPFPSKRGKTSLPDSDSNPAAPRRWLAALLSTMLCAPMASFAGGQIGFNFRSGASDTLAAAEQAGAPGYEQANWNNGGAAEAGTSVVDKDGLATGVKVWSSANNTWGNGAGTATPDAKLMTTYLDNSGIPNDNSAPYQFSANGNRPEIYVEGLRAWMNTVGATAYDVVVYFDGDSTIGRIGEYWLQQAAGKGSDGLPNALGLDLTPHVFGADFSNFGATQSYAEVPDTANSIANAVMGNFMVLKGSDSDNFILRTQCQPGPGVTGTFRAVINAFQIVPKFAAASPVIGSDPMSQARYAGMSATFSVSAYGPSLRYQWAKAGVGDLADATNSSLTISNVSVSDSGTQYYVKVSNGAGQLQSATATLTVLSVPHDGGYVATVLSNSPVAYWRFNEGSNPLFDYVGSHNAMAGASAQYAGDFGLNPAGQFLGFETGNTGWTTANGNYDGSVVAPPLNLMTNRVTLIAWLYPTAPTGQQKSWAGILTTRAGNCGMTYTDSKGELGYLWNGYYSFHSTLRIPEQMWSMVAMVVEPDQVTLYVVNPTNGLLSATDKRTSAVCTWGGAAFIGVDPQFPFSRGFDGAIDEVAVFNQSLSSGQILSLYSAARAAGNLPPVIGQQPVSQAIYTGRNAQFNVRATGAGALTYQWKQGATALVDGGAFSGTRTATLTISNATAANAGSYSVEIGNPAGKITSDTVTLSLVTPTGSAFEAAMLAANPLAYWRFSETSGSAMFDNIGGFTGTAGGAAYLGLGGPTPPDFPGLETTNTAVQTTQNLPGSYVEVPPLFLNTNAITLTAWIYSAGSQDNFAGLVFCRGSGTISGLNYNNGQLSYTWNNDWNWSSGLAIPQNQWVFVALVVEPTRGTVYLGANGSVQFARKLAVHAPQTFSAPICIGGDAAFGDTRIFSGQIDEVGIFNRSLTSDEIIRLYSQGSGAAVAPQITIRPPSTVVGFPGMNATFSADAIGAGPLSYQWYRGTNALIDGGAVSGAQTPGLTLTHTLLSDAGEYTLVVTGAAGSATSSVCTLKVGAPPASPYHTQVLAAGPIAHWRLNETSGTVAHDLVGGHDGAYGTAMTLGAAGQQTAGLFGFGPDTAAATFTRNTSQSWVDVPALDLNTNTVTIMAWVYPTLRPDNWTGIFLTKSPSTAGIMFRDNTPNTLGMMWNNGAFWSSGTSLAVPVNQWSLVALAVEPSQATLYVMNSSGTNTWVKATSMNNEPWSGPGRIGNDSYAVSRTFNGSINEVSVFGRTLSGDELGQLYAAAVTEQHTVALEVERTGANLRLTWPQGILLEATSLAGPWTTNTSAVSPWVVTPSAPQKFYRVSVQ